MDIRAFLPDPAEKPLDRIVTDGGLFAIFRRVCCIGDSLASGEFESIGEDGVKHYHDMYEYSWGQYMARMAGNTVLNFSRGGMTAKEYLDSFADANGFWDPDKACQAYIIALGVNDLVNQGQAVGTATDGEGEDTFAARYAAIIRRLKVIQPDARFFLMTMPRETRCTPQQEAVKDAHRQLLYDFAAQFTHTYVVDIRTYGPVYDEAFRAQFNLGGHLNPAGYLFTAKITASYIDHIIRHHMEDFKQVAFIGTPHRYRE